MSTWGIVHPNPMWAIVSQPVLAAIFIITPRATHLDELLPAGSKAFIRACEARDLKDKVLEVQYEHQGTKKRMNWH